MSDMLGRVFGRSFETAAPLSHHHSSTAKLTPFFNRPSVASHRQHDSTFPPSRDTTALRCTAMSLEPLTAHADTVVNQAGSIRGCLSFVSFRSQDSQSQLPAHTSQRSSFQQPYPSPVRRAEPSHDDCRRPLSQELCAQVAIVIRNRAPLEPPLRGRRDRCST